MSQAELFEQGDVPSGDGWSVFEGKGGVEVRYLTVDERIVRVDLGTGETLPVTLQSQDRNYTVIPGYGEVQERNGGGGKPFLSKLAMVRRVLYERKAREAAEAAAAEAKQREQEAVDNLVKATLADGQANRGGGGCKTYHGASPFVEYGPRINPHAEPFLYAKAFLWLLRAPIRAEWVKVYLYCANEARADGVCAVGAIVIAHSTGLSKGGVKSALDGLAQYRLISEQPGKGGNDSRRIYFHEHPWMKRVEDTGSGRDPVPGHDVSLTGSRRDPPKEEKKVKNFYRACANPRTEARTPIGQEKDFGNAW